MLKLFHTPFDPESRFIRLVLSEYAENFEPVEIKAWERREDVLMMNPAGTAPILVDGDHVFCGAFVIAEYLDETRGPLLRDKRLMPENSVERAEVRRLLHWYLVKLREEATGPLAEQKIDMMELGGHAPDSEIIRAARINIRPHLKYTGYLASTRNYIGGIRLSYADLAAAAAFSVADYTGDVPWSEDEACKNWFMRIKSRPAFRQLLSDRVRGLPPSPTYAELDF